MQIRIYLTVRRHKNQIQSTQVQAEVQCREATNFSFLIKSTDGVYYLYLVFLVCNLLFLLAWQLCESTARALLPFLSDCRVYQFIFEPFHLLLEDEAH